MSGFGGLCDYQGPTRVHPGSAIVARNVRFNRRRVRQRDGMVDTAFRQTINGSVITGYDVLEVVGTVNPGFYLIALTAAGVLYIEQPSGSGAFVPLATPFTLPTNARMQTTSAYNCLYMAFTDGVRGLCPPLRFNGLTQTVEPVSQNPIGSRWTPGRFAQVGDLVQSSSQIWWRCIQPGFMGPEPGWLGQLGYFNDDTWTPVTVTSNAGGPNGQTEWEEWTPAFENLLPTPNTTGARGRVIAGGGTIPAGKDIYVRLAYNSDETGEGPWTPPFIIPTGHGGTVAVEVYFRTVGFGPGPGGPSMLRWLAELNIRSDAFFPFKLNVYAGEVASGGPAPTTYYQVQADVSVGTPITLTTDPTTGVISENTRPTVVASPDPGFGGTVAFLNPTFANDGSSSTAAVGKAQSLEHIIHEPGGGDDTNDVVVSSSAIWSSFPTPPATPSTVFLFVDYAATALLLTAGNDVSATLEYTLDNGATWVLIDTFTDSGKARTVFKVAMSGGQDYTKIKVRARAVGSSPSTQGNSTLNLSVYDIRVGVNAVIGQILLRTTASGIDLFGAPLFTGETGLRYVIILREDDTGSLSPVDPASPIPVLFTNGDAQLIAILPDGAPSTSQTILAIGVSGSGAGGPFFDIVESDPPDPASSAITTIQRDGNGTVTATVQSALEFEAGVPILVYDVGSGFDGSFVLANVDTTNNQLEWAQDGVAAQVDGAGNVAEQQNNLRTAADAPDTFFALNFDDDFLSKSRDDTALLTFIAAPPSTDISFIPTLQKMCYVDETGTFFFSQTQDPGNIAGSGGQLQIEAAAGGRGIAVREMTHGQVIALKSNGGYQLDTSDVTPANWNPERLWELHGPPCAAMIAVGQDFLVYGCKGGGYYYAGGEPLWITQEIQSDDEDEENTGSWNEIDWTSELTFWCAVNEDAKEVHFGVCTDDSGFPNEIYRVSYTGGWDFPEARTRTGALITPDTARKWSRDPIAARCGRYVKRTITAPAYCAGDGYTVTGATRAAGVVTLQFGASMPPAAVGDRIRVAITGDASFNGDFPVSAMAAGPPSLSYVQAGPDAVVAGPNAGSASLLTKVEDMTAVKGMATHQMTYALSPPAELKDYAIVSLTRAAQVVTAIVQAQQLIGSTTTVIVDGAGTFDGSFAATSAVNNNDGTWTLKWAQQQPDENVEQGILSTTIQCVRLTAFQPGRRDDNGVGIDQQYQPSYTQDGRGSVMQFGGLRGKAKGAGKLLFRFVTEDPTITLEDDAIDLKDNQALTEFQRAASNGDPLLESYGAPLFTNGGEAGSGFELVELVVCANPWLPGGDD